MEPAVEKRGSQLIFKFPEKRVSLPITLRKEISQTKPTRTSTPILEMV